MSSKKAWIGSSLPDSNDSWVLIPELLVKANFHRVHPSLHRNFQEVHFIENNLADFMTWPIILDELLRLVNGKAKIFIKIRTSSPYFSIATFNKKVYSYVCGKVKLLTFEIVDSSILLSFEIEKDLNILDNNWTFGIVWDGKNKSYLEKFIDSVHMQNVSVKYEIIICGPETDLQNSKNCIFVTPDELVEKLSNISIKKNLIVENANYSNICIVHNRYQLEDNFIESFEQFGLDYDVAIIKQHMESGQRVPDWITQGSNFIFTQNYLMEYDDYSPYQYIGGGMMIAKKDILLKHKWNSLGVWNSGEDIDLSERLRNAGIQVRFNPFSKAIVLSLRKGIIEDFKPISTKDIIQAKYDVFSTDYYKIGIKEILFKFARYIKWRFLK